MRGERGLCIARVNRAVPLAVDTVVWRFLTAQRGCLAPSLTALSLARALCVCFRLLCICVRRFHVHDYSCLGHDLAPLKHLKRQARWRRRGRGLLGWPASFSFFYHLLRRRVSANSQSDASVAGPDKGGAGCFVAMQLVTLFGCSVQGQRKVACGDIGKQRAQQESMRIPLSPVFLSSPLSPHLPLRGPDPPDVHLRVHNCACGYQKLNQPQQKGQSGRSRSARP